MRNAERDGLEQATRAGGTWLTPLAAGVLIGVVGSIATVAMQPAHRRVVGGRDELEEVGAAQHRLADGWKALLLGSFKAFSADQIPAWAAGVTFFGLLALFPALAAFVSLYGLFGDANEARQQITALGGLLPGGAISVLTDQLTRLSNVKHASLGIAFGASLLISLWSSNAGVKALFAALNAAYETKERRGFVLLNAVSLTFTAGLVLFFILAIATIVAAPSTLTLVGLRGLARFAPLRWPLILVVITAILSVLYRYGPSRRSTRWRWITPGSIVASCGWIAMSAAFSWYVGNFGHFDATYGALGGVVGFMTWIWLSLMIVLFGAELNAGIERQAKTRA